MSLVDRRSVQNFDWVFLLFIVILVILGLVNLMSAAAAGVEGGTSNVVRRHIIVMGAAAMVMGVCAFVDYRHVERFAPVIFVFSLFLLGLTLVVGVVTRGAQAWLFEGGSFQPSEFAKVALVIMLARYFHRNPPSTIQRLRQLVPPFLIVALPIGLILLQRDLGVALLTLLVALTYLPLLHIPMRAWSAIAGLAAAGLAALTAGLDLGGEVVGPAGPTTATRMDTFTETMLDLGLLAMIGKAERGHNAVEVISRFKVAYLMATGGAAYLVSRAIKGARVVAFEDLGMEAIYEFEVEDMPVTVAVDAAGNNVHTLAPAEWRRRIAEGEFEPAE